MTVKTMPLRTAFPMATAPTARAVGLKTVSTANRLLAPSAPARR